MAEEWRSPSASEYARVDNQSIAANRLLPACRPLRIPQRRGRRRILSLSWTAGFP